MGWFGRNEHDEERLSAYLDGELDPRQAEIVERHLSTCSACTALLEELRGTKMMLSALPAQAPRRSFVLGVEHARAPARQATPPRRLSWALAPAAALSVFVVLVFVDLAANTSTSSDESAGTFTAASVPEAADDASAGGGSTAATGAPPAAENTGSEAGPMIDSATAEDAPQPEAPADAQGSTAAAGAAQTQEDGEALRSSGVEATPGDGNTAVDAPDEEPAPEPAAFEAPDDKDGGISTLRVLQVVAGAAFLASGFYVFVWPRVSRGGS
jgi:anti-sigma factor RsiW